MNGRQSHARGLSFLVAMVCFSLWGRASGQSPGGLAELQQRAVQAAVAKIAPSVLRIETVGGMDLPVAQQTTGVVVDERGYLISSAFNFVQKPTSILVELPSGKLVAAEIAARDHSRQLVLLRIETKEQLIVPKFAEASSMRVGQSTIAIGRTLGGELPNLSVGILSALDRIWGRAIQTDCKVSPLNYGGPLIDIRGDMLGILVPLSPEPSNEVVGAEWYDSGIGFAIPAQDIQRVLDRLIEGQDLYPGLLGITLEGRNEMADPAVVSLVSAGTPAAKSGLIKGDRIVAIDGRPIATQTQLKTALGPHYAGDEVAITVERDKGRLDFSATLVESIDPFELPFLGVLPRRNTVGNALVVRYVFDDSPAAEIGLRPGDRLEQLNADSLLTVEEWRRELALVDLADPVTLSWMRDDQRLTNSVRLTSQPESIPDDFGEDATNPQGGAGQPIAVGGANPTANDPIANDPIANDPIANDPIANDPTANDPTANDPTANDPTADKARVDTLPQKSRILVDVRIPEEPHECIALLPAGFDSDAPHGLVIWLGPPGKLDSDALRQRWAEACQRYSLVVLAVPSQDARRWQPTEVEVIRKAIDIVMKDYAIDASRVVVHGYQSGAAMAWRVAMSHREIIRAVANVEMPFTRLQLRGNDPVERLAFYLAWHKSAKTKIAIDAATTAIRKFGFPVTEFEMTAAEYLDATELQSMLRWIDSLDRL